MVCLEEAMAGAGAKVVGTRCVICNTGDANDPDVTARLLAQEVSHHSDASFFAATPPLESKLMLFSQWATEKTRGGERLQLSFIDVRKAYFHGVPTRRLYVRLPPKWGWARVWWPALRSACTGQWTQVPSGRAFIAPLSSRWVSPRALRHLVFFSQCQRECLRGCPRRRLYRPWNTISTHPL